MKKSLIFILLFPLLLFLNSCSSISLGGGYPDLTKALPQARFLEATEQSPGKKTYTYLALKNFSSNKGDLEEYLGDDWVNIPVDQSANSKLESILKKSTNSKTKTMKVSGSAVYLSPKYRNTSLMIVQLKTDSPYSGVIIVEERM